MNFSNMGFKLKFNFSVLIFRNGISFKTIGNSTSIMNNMTPPWNETTLSTLLLNYILGNICNAENRLFYQCCANKLKTLQCFNHIKQLPSAHIKQLPSTHIKQLPSAHIKQLPSAHIKQLPSAHIKQLPSAHIKQLPSAHIKQLPSAHIKQLPSAHIKQLLSAHIKQLPSARIKQLPSAHIKQLPSAQNQLKSWITKYSMQAWSGKACDCTLILTTHTIFSYDNLPTAS